MEASRYNKECPICHGTGFTLEDHDMYYYFMKLPESERPEDMEHLKGFPMQPLAVPCPRCNGQQAKVKIRQARAELPDIMQEAMLCDFDWNLYVDPYGKRIDTSKKQQLVNLFLYQFKEWQKRGIGLYISSATRGSGKTFLASAICNELMINNYIQAQFVSAADLIPIHTGEYKRSKVTTDTLMDVPLLVIDDLGKENNGVEWTEDILYIILDERMANRRVTIITSNYKVEELKYDSRITDRINKMTFPVELPEVSIRTAQAAEEKIELLRAVGFQGGSR